MTFFGKLKNLHSGPPAPPRRAGSEAGGLSLPLFADDNAGWPQDEFDDEEGDMYEAPPCERPAVKVPQRTKVQENVYMERTSRPAVPQRQAPPPPRPGKPAGTTAQNVAAPEIDRSEKPGRKKTMPPPPPTCSVPAPSLASNVDEDVYLDPNEEQEYNDDLYLEPTAACPPVPRGLQQTRIPPGPKPIMAPSPTPMAKPPVPRAKSNSLLTSVNGLKPAPEARLAAHPVKIPPPTPSYKPPLPANLREAKSIPPNSLVTDNKAAVPSCARPVKHSGNDEKVWFAGDCNRKMAEEFLLKVNKDGAFLIRRSSNQSPRQPYTLAVLYQQKVYNVPIRFLEDVKGYALGKEGKKNEEVFNNLDEMISHHRRNQLLLVDSKSQAKHRAYLTHPAHP